MSASATPDSAERQWKEARQRFLVRLRVDRREAGYMHDWELAPLLRRTEQEERPQSYTVSKILRGERGGLARPPSPPEPASLFDEPIVKHLFNGLNVEPTARSELGRLLLAARRAFHRRSRRTGPEDAGLDLAGVQTLSSPLVPPEALRAIATKDVRRALNFADKHIQQPQRSRALAFVLETTPEMEPDLAREVVRRAQTLHHNLQHLLQHSYSVTEGDRPRPVDTIQAAMTLGVAECRLGRHHCRTGWDLINRAGMLGYALNDELQRCQALANAATAVTLAAAGISDPSDSPGDPGSEWRQAALHVAESLSGPYLSRVIGRTAVSQSMARSRSASSQHDAHTLLTELETRHRALSDDVARRARMFITGAWCWLDPEYAGRLAAELPCGPERDRAQGSVAAAAAWQDRLDVAQRAQNLIEDPWERARALGLISYRRDTSSSGRANDTATAGDTAEQALDLALVSPEPHLVVHAFAALVPPLAADASRHELANHILDRTVHLGNSSRLPAHERAHALSAVTIAATRVGRLDQAAQLYIETGDSVHGLDDGGHERLHALVATAEAAVALAAMQDQDEGHQSNFLPDSSGNGITVEGVLRDASLALEQTKASCEPLEVVYALAAFSRLLIQVGDFPGASHALEEGWQVRERVSNPGALSLTAYALIEQMVFLEEPEAQHLATVTDSTHDPLVRSMAFAALAAACPPGDPRSDDYLRMARTTRESLGGRPRDLATIRIADALMVRDDPDELEVARGEIEHLAGHVQAEAWGRLASAYTRHGMDRSARQALQQSLGKSRPPWAAVDAIVAANEAIAVHVPTPALNRFVDQAID